MAGSAGSDGGYVAVNISSSLSSFASQRRYPVSTTIGDLKGKLELITGATAALMQLQLFDREGKMVCELDDDSVSLGSSGVQDGWRVSVVDRDPNKQRGEFEDMSQVKKYEMNNEEYAKRQDSVLAFKARMKLGRFAEGTGSHELAEEVEKKEREKADAIPVGSRCEVTVAKSIPKKGTVMFVGKTQFKSGYWIGVKYDEPLGKNDGSVNWIVKGVKYFECPPKYGVFVKPSSVQVGDFPEDLYSDDEM